MMIQNGKNLEVYKLAFENSLTLHKLSLEFPKIEQYELASQLRRSSKSICANLVEGFAKQSSSKSEFGRFISIAMGSCKEVQLWLDYCLNLKYIRTELYKDLFSNYEKIFAMLSKLKSKLV